MDCGNAIMFGFQSLMYIIIQTSSLYRDVVRMSHRIIYLLVSGLGEDAKGIRYVLPPINALLAIAIFWHCVSTWSNVAPRQWRSP